MGGTSAAKPQVPKPQTEPTAPHLEATHTQQSVSTGPSRTATIDFVPNAGTEQRQDPPSQAVDQAAQAAQSIAQAPQPAASSQPGTPSDAEQQHQAAVLARAQEVSAAQQDDTKEVANLRGALRGRLLGKPIDFPFLQQGIDCVLAAVQTQFSDVEPKSPVAKTQRAGETADDL